MDDWAGRSHDQLDRTNGHVIAGQGPDSGDLASGDLASGDLASGDLASGDLASGAAGRASSGWSTALADRHDDDADRANGFSRLDPRMSARSGPTRAQLAFVGFAAGLLALGTAVLPGATAMTMGLFAAIAFAALLAVRVFAIYVMCRSVPRSEPTRCCPAAPMGASGARLPTYTVLVTLYHEARVAQTLVAALDALEYPRDRLEIVFLLESDDDATRKALEKAGLSDHMRILVVPDGLPRTKPRALCYGLARTRGEYVVVYDAEDRPETGQLLEAVSAFRHDGPDLGCLQARLNVYNPQQSVISGQFAVEYTALFDGILPALAKAGAPVPLGGTSNHFPRAVLEQVGGWDPWNVTEDADLGLRLARFGFRVGALRSTTWEEAPPTFAVWFRQRTRWQKGWIQTYMVHMRDPVALWRDLGTARFLWFQVVLGGGLMAAAAHPWFIAGLASAMMAREAFSPLETAGQAVIAHDTLSNILWWAGVASLGGAAAAAIALSLLTIRRRGFTGLDFRAIVCPLIWLPVSVAAYFAVVELLRRPFHWAKTPHGVVAKTATSGSGAPQVAPVEL